MCVKDFLNCLAPLAKQLPVSLVFSEVFVVWVCGWFGPFLHCLVLTQMSGPPFMPRPSPRAWRVGGAKSGRHCFVLNHPGWEASQLVAPEEDNEPTEA